APGGLERRTVIEVVPATTDPGFFYRGGRGHLHLLGPGRVNAGPEGRNRSELGKRHSGSYQVISMSAVFRPEPTPMQRMRSPATKWALSSARVMGRAAAATLPQTGKVMGMRSRSIPTASIMALVWALEIWWVT